MFLYKSEQEEPSSQPLSILYLHRKSQCAQVRSLICYCRMSVCVLVSSVFVSSKSEQEDTVEDTVEKAYNPPSLPPFIFIGKHSVRKSEAGQFTDLCLFVHPSACIPSSVAGIQLYCAFVNRQAHTLTYRSASKFP